MCWVRVLLGACLRHDSGDYLLCERWSDIVGRAFSQSLTVAGLSAAYFRIRSQDKYVVIVRVV